MKLDVYKRQIQNNPQKQHFVKDIIDFAHDNNILTLAEGIETSEEMCIRDRCNSVHLYQKISPCGVCANDCQTP